MKIYFDLETTGLIRPQILQIAAVVAGNKNTFNRYLRPTIPIDPNATRMNGLFMKNGCLVKRKVDGGEELLSTVEMSEGLQQFFDWADDQAEDVQLVAYNGKRFDFPVLRK